MLANERTTDAAPPRLSQNGSGADAGGAVGQGCLPMASPWKTTHSDGVCATMCRANGAITEWLYLWRYQVALESIKHQPMYAHCVELCIPCYIPINEVARPRSRTASRATQTTPGAAQSTQDEIQGRSWCIAALDLKFASTRATERRMRYRFLGLSRQIRFRLYSHSNVSALSVNNKAPLCRNWESNKKEKPSQPPPPVTQNGTAVPFATDPERPGG